MTDKALQGKVAVVAGATRGAGRGIAAALGERGATVYCTGRTTATTQGMEGRKETIEDTARLVTELGGEGVPVRTDHMEQDQVRALFARVQEESGRLDVLVNDIWGGDPVMDWAKRFWEADLDKMLPMMRNAIETHLITARHGVPLMVEQGNGLVIEITDGDGYMWRGNLAYDLVKTTVIRMAFDMAMEARPKGIAAVAVTPGFLRSEAMLEHFGVTEENWRDGARKDEHFIESETPRFVGRAVAALASDPNVMQKTGRVYASWTLAKEYGFTDVDGRTPDWGTRFHEKVMPDYKPADDGFYAYWQRGPFWLGAEEDS